MCTMEDESAPAGKLVSVVEILYAALGPRESRPCLLRVVSIVSPVADDTSCLLPNSKHWFTTPSFKEEGAGKRCSECDLLLEWLQLSTTCLATQHCWAKDSFATHTDFATRLIRLSGKKQGDPLCIGQFQMNEYLESANGAWTVEISFPSAWKSSLGPVRLLDCFL